MSENCYRCLYHKSHRCRNQRTCPDGYSYVEYTGSTVRQCLLATVEVFQDGYIHCPILESIGCEKCTKDFGDGSDFEYDESQNYERKPDWRKENGMESCGLPKGSEGKCCLNRNGMCTLNEADFYDIDRAEGMRGCGFIGINDRYLMWKYGVPYKEHICGNCRYYEVGEYSNGICTNEQVKPHPKGTKVNNETVYIDSKEYYNGAHACKEFKKKEEEVKEVPKQTYWTKCGRKFEKNSTATVTGFEIDVNDPICADCPFQVDVKEGYPQVHKKWECRAGSKKPNHTNEWTGSLEDKNTISIHSLDNNFMESVLEYCENHPDLGASYNADHMADCRRTLSISCSSNKKGIAAKKELIEKFFSEKKTKLCSDCIYRTKAQVGKDHPMQWMCRNADHRVGYDFHFGDDCEGCSNHTSKDKRCEKDICGDCNQFILDTGATSNADKPIVIIAKGSSGNDAETCANCAADKESCQAYQVCMSEELKPEECVCENWKGEAKELYIDEDKKCKSKNEKCGYYCKHNEGCSLLIVAPGVLKNVLEAAHDKDEECSVYKQTCEKLYPERVEKPENALEEVETNVSAFDYSTVDAETGAFLQEKANRITEIRIKSVVAIGKELKEAQDMLASHDKTKGTFQKWVESIGITPKTAYNYINGFDYVVKNFHNIEDAEQIQPSLLFVASKPSAPKELSDKVASGDITTHKQYKKLEAKLKEETQIREKAEKERKEAECKQKTLEAQNKSLLRDYETTKQQLDQAKRNGDPSKVQELGKMIHSYQQEIESYQYEIGKLNQRLNEKDEQLKNKPIEVTAAKEVIPEWLIDAVFNKITGLVSDLVKITDEEIKVYSDGIDPDYYDNIHASIKTAIFVLNKLDQAADNAVNGVTPSETHAGNCGACKFADIDKVSDEQMDDDKTWCTLHNKLVDFCDCCNQYKQCTEE